MRSRDDGWSRSRAALAAGRWTAASRLRIRPGIALPHPAGHAKDRQTQRTTTNQAPAARLLRRQHLTVGLDGFAIGHPRRPRPLPTRGHWYPAGENRKRLRRARRTLLRVVHLFAIEAETRGTKLHGDQCTKGFRPKVVR